MISESTYTLNRIIIYSFVFFFQFFGLFGNINLVVLTFRKKSLQTKYGLLLMILAVVHCFCLCFEYISMGLAIATSFYNFPIHRHLCFLTMFPYIFAHSLQTGIIFQLAFDLFFTIFLPSKHMTIDTRIYFPILFTPAIIYGTVTVIFGAIYVDDQVIPMCNPPSALVEIVNNFWYILMFTFSFLTLFFYVFAFGLLFYKSKMKAEAPLLERKAMKTLKLLIFIFLFARLLSTFFMNILVLLKFSEEAVALAKNYNIICGLVAYSQNAYVCYFRSAEYRSLFNDQFAILLSRRAKTSASIRGSTQIKF